MTSQNARVHFRYRKVSPDVLDFMRLLRGYRITFSNIAKVCQINEATVQYHLNPSVHAKALARARVRFRKKPSKKDPEKRRAWARQYSRERYHEDPVYRAKMLRANKGGKFSGSLQTARFPNTKAKCP